MSKIKKNPTLPSKEIFGRMNFLHQASILMAKQNNSVLSAFYGRQCQSIGKKAQLRISPVVKRDFCKRCGLAQEPNITAELEIVTQRRNQKNKVKAKANNANIDKGAEVFIKCGKCENKRKFVVNPQMKFWVEEPTAVEELRSSPKQINKNQEGTSNTKNQGKNDVAKALSKN